MPEEIPAVADPAPEEIVAPVSAPAPVDEVIAKAEIIEQTDAAIESEPNVAVEVEQDEIEELKARLSALEAHFLQVVGHLAQSFGDVYKAKHDSLKGA